MEDNFIEVRCSGKLLFKLRRDGGEVEIKVRDSIYAVDLPETIQRGSPVVRVNTTGAKLHLSDATI